MRLHATFATPNPRPGPVALLSESGTIGGVILDRIGEAGLGASSFAAIGNRADVSANDMLQYWADDPRTELVLLYLESFGNARKFSRIARELGRTKPIVAVKSQGAARAYPTDGADAHPAAIEALLEQTGVVRVDTLAQLLDVARVLACQPLPDGDRVALVGNGGGSLALAADACVDAGLVLAELGTGVRRQLGAGPARVPGGDAGAGEHRRPGVRGRPRRPGAGAPRPCSVTTGWTACSSSARRRPGSRRPTWCAPWRRRGPTAPARRCWPASSAPTRRPSRRGRHRTCRCSTSRMPPPTRWGG